MNNEELLAKYKAIFPDNVEAIVVRKDDYDRLYGDLTIENIELKQEIERLNDIINELEKWLNQNISDIIAYFDNAPFGEEQAYRNTLDKLQELKGVDKE